jgi:hypothetical protein
MRAGADRDIVTNSGLHEIVTGDFMSAVASYQFLKMLGSVDAQNSWGQSNLPKIL